MSQPARTDESNSMCNTLHVPVSAPPPYHGVLPMPSDEARCSTTAPTNIFSTTAHGFRLKDYLCKLLTIVDDLRELLFVQ